MKNPFSKKNPSQQEAFLRTYLDRIAFLQQTKPFYRN